MRTKTEGGVMGGFPFSGLELLPKVRQTVRGTGLDRLHFRCLGLLKGWHSEAARPSDVIKYNANKRNSSPSCFGIT